MKVYFAGSIRGISVNGQKMYNSWIIGGIRELGHKIVSEHVLVKPETDMEAWSNENIYSQDIAWIDQAEALVAEICGPSHGVGYEIAYAVFSRKIPVLTLYPRHLENKPSAMLLGSPHLTKGEYHDKSDVDEILREWFDVIGSK